MRFVLLYGFTFFILHKGKQRFQVKAAQFVRFEYKADIGIGVGKLNGRYGRLPYVRLIGTRTFARIVYDNFRF